MNAKVREMIKEALQSDGVEEIFKMPDDKAGEMDIFDDDYLAKAVKVVVDDKVKYTDWNQRDDIKSELKVGLILVLAEYGYPPVDRDEVYKEIFEQAENFKKYRG